MIMILVKNNVALTASLDENHLKGRNKAINVIDFNDFKRSLFQNSHIPYKSSTKPVNNWFI
jgi:hypothetical protein